MSTTTKTTRWTLEYRLPGRTDWVSKKYRTRKARDEMARWLSEHWAGVEFRVAGYTVHV